MKERPILFSAPMVLALLDGSKTMTRRVVKPQPTVDALFCGGAYITHSKGGDVAVDASYIDSFCPYGQPGDRLWVRESFDIIEGQTPGYVIGIDYRASHPECKPSSSTGERFEAGRDTWQWRMKDIHGMRRWKPSIHMPRTASRITLEITRVRVERLHACNEIDAIAEGAPWTQCAYEHPSWTPYRLGYCKLWESINGPGSWNLNPWVWVIEFKRVQP